MQSTEITSAPKDEKGLRVWLERILKDHYRDIRDLYEMTTDCDQFEQKQRDNNG